MYACEKYTVYIGFGIIHASGIHWGVYEYISWSKEGLLYI